MVWIPLFGEENTDNNCLISAPEYPLDTRLQNLYKEYKSAVVRVKGLIPNSAKDPESSESVQAGNTAPSTGELASAGGTWTAGTGFFISAQGDLLTSASLVHSVKEFWVDIQGIMYAAELRGCLPLVGIALLKLKEYPPSPINFICLNDGVSSPQVPSTIFSLGYPYNLNISPTSGLLVGSDAEFLDNPFATYYFRINILTAAGEPGSPVFDLNGRLLGMRIVSLQQLNASYVLPVRAIQRVLDDLQIDGQVQFGYVGIESVAINLGTPNYKVVVERVHANSPAALAGVRVGDQIIGFGDFPIKSVSDVRNAAFFAKVNQYTTISLIRSGRRLDLSLKISKLPVALEKPIPSETNPNSQIK